jgi:hypothetical protein
MILKQIFIISPIKKSFRGQQKIRSTAQHIDRFGGSNGRLCEQSKQSKVLLGASSFGRCNRSISISLINKKYILSALSESPFNSADLQGDYPHAGSQCALHSFSRTNHHSAANQLGLGYFLHSHSTKMLFAALLNSSGLRGWPHVLWRQSNHPRGLQLAGRLFG